MSTLPVNPQGSEAKRQAKAPLGRADRLFIQVTIAAWLVTYAAIIVIIFRSGLPEAADASLLTIALVFAAVVAAMLSLIAVAVPLRIVLNVALKDRRRSHRSETIALTALLALVIAYPLEVRRERNRLAPPSGATQLSEFARLVPAPRLLNLVRHDRNDYFVWY